MPKYMNMDTTFRYSKFYVITPIGALACLGLGLFAMIYWNPLHTQQEKDQLVPWLLLICFLLFGIAKVVFHFTKIIKAPVLFRLDNESISIVYRDGRVDQIFWKDIESIKNHRDPWRPGLETIEITLKDGSEQTLCNNFLKKYKLFKLAIKDISSGQVTMVNFV